MHDFGEKSYWTFVTSDFLYNVFLNYFSVWDESSELWLKKFVVVFMYRGADKSLARPGKKQATATEDFEFHISYL
jgi:hypothetical protein